MYNEEYRHTSLIATLRKVWGLGDAFTQRDASARTFDQVFSLDEPRRPEDWVTVEAQPVPAWTLDVVAAGGALSTLGKAIGPGLIDAAKKMGVPLPAELDWTGCSVHPRTHHQVLEADLLAPFPQADAQRHNGLRSAR